MGHFSGRNGRDSNSGRRSKEKRRSQIPSFFSEGWRVGVTEVPQLRGRCLQQQKINPTPKLILRKREVKYLNLCPGGFGGTTKLEVFLPTLTESTTPHTRMPRNISKASLIPSNKWDTSADKLGVSRTQEDPVAVKFKTTKLEEVFLTTLTESTTPHTRMPRDISKASLIPSNKWDTSTEEMGVNRTQEEDPKKNVAVKF
ncbi:hypothetical protein CDAR_242771 [Caerostris darwini]|uniref:Uncharacterized protein n=1 Tax=Caerostris darwini TaxID=1538125 RepID=A0AAV4W2P0_9ARAC|nr:hypothetical protein CDAR_242771 [Caerostris darwini]